MKERLHYLFERYITNTCTGKELGEFLTIVRQEQHNDTVRELIQTLYQDIRNTDPSHTSVNEQGQLVVQNHEWLTSSVPTPEKRNSRRSFAIGIILILVVGMLLAGWFLWPSGPSASSNTTTGANQQPAQ